MSNMLYEKRFGPYFCGPVVAGLNPDNTPYLAGTDSIGAVETAKDFMVSGTAPESLTGICESFWKPGMVCPYFSLLVAGRCCLGQVNAVIRTSYSDLASVRAQLVFQTTVFQFLWTLLPVSWVQRTHLACLISYGHSMNCVK